MAAVTVAQSWPQMKNYSSMPQTERPKTDDYIQELQDLYEIAKDELEIAAESTAASTIYAVSDRISLREAFDDLDRAYAAYTGTAPRPSHLERPPPSSPDNQDWDSSSNSGGAAAKEGDEANQEKEEEEEEGGSSMAFNPAEVPDEVREEIKRRVGQRIRELRNAVDQLEESVRE
ncbi:hypothetical protein AJ78_06813 [Emergomyces pasteurianus Ep9510]|uniref:Uncharacterized protein n=1 Tax=Emergomyces pasteurianus Ep9510 TaxID=1447872 RepID=A0A1J9P9L3_9EURO|nr:hypothetical protein AJ78_06813 [Emergomyces pasteurianus Ep9510]